MNAYYVKSLSTIRKVTLQSSAKVDWNYFISNSKKMLGDIHSFNPDFSIILGDFNARSNKWWVGDTQTSEGSQINSLSTSYGFRQLNQKQLIF